MSWTPIDHTFLSPSGRVSRAARRAAWKRESQRLAEAWRTDEQRQEQKLSRVERLKRTAAGHPDNASVQAARRILAAMGAI